MWRQLHRGFGWVEAEPPFPFAACGDVLITGVMSCPEGSQRRRASRVLLARSGQSARPLGDEKQGTEMNKRIIAILLFLLILAPGGSPGFGQESSEPLSKSEILQLLRQSQSTPLTQGDIAAEVDRRGVDFQADDQTLRQLEQAGAHSFLLRAIVRTAKFASEPHPPSPELLGVADANARAEALAKLPLLEQARFHALEYVNDLPNLSLHRWSRAQCEQPDSGIGFGRTSWK